MAHPPPYPGSGDDSGASPNRGSTDGAPRWVSVVGIIAFVVLVVLMVVLHLSGVIGSGAH
jgi:cytochrome b561